MVLKLYGSPFSTCTKRVAVVLHEKQVPFELIPVDYAKGEHKTPEFLEKQPFGQMPYIVSVFNLTGDLFQEFANACYSRTMMASSSMRAAPSATISPPNTLTRERL